jgi:PEGA domain-containing protein
MKRFLNVMVCFLITLFLIGCVDRRFVVTTDPPGALVMRNNAPIGFAPADDHFVYYGNYHFTLIKDGYETQQIDQKIPAPWYEYPPFDFFAENLLPWHIIDVRRFHYQMQPRQLPNADEMLNHAQELRDRGRIVSPPPEAPVPAVPSLGTPIAPGTEPPVSAVNPPPGTIPSTIYPPG